jgi:hypothetical protein
MYLPTIPSIPSLSAETFVKYEVVSSYELLILALTQLDGAGNIAPGCAV